MLAEGRFQVGILPIMFFVTALIISGRCDAQTDDAVANSVDPSSSVKPSVAPIVEKELDVDENFDIE